MQTHFMDPAPLYKSYVRAHFIVLTHPQALTRQGYLMCACIHARAHACLFGMKVIMYKILVHCKRYTQMYSFL